MTPALQSSCSVVICRRPRAGQAQGAPPDEARSHDWSQRAALPGAGLALAPRSTNPLDLYELGLWVGTIDSINHELYFEDYPMYICFFGRFF